MFQSKIKEWLECAVDCLPNGYNLFRFKKDLSPKEMPAISYHIHSYEEVYEGDDCDTCIIGLELNGYLPNPDECKERIEFYNTQLAAIELIQKHLRTIIKVLTKYYDLNRVKGRGGSIKWQLMWCSTAYDLMRVRARVTLEASKQEPCCEDKELLLDKLVGKTLKPKWTDEQFKGGKKLF